MKRILIYLLLLSGTLFAQKKPTQTFFTIPKAATVSMGEIKEDWNPVIQKIEAPAPGIGTSKRKFLDMKDSLSRVYPKKHNAAIRKTPTIPAPYQGRNMQGNIYNSSTPNDNDIAISNGNMIISVQNSTIYKYDVDSGISTGYISLGAFASVLGNPNVKYDPKTIYDPVSDKFAVIFLNGYTDSTSSITVAFSTSNDPNGSWNMYELPGNPFNNGLWTDYPMVAMTDQELFITGNLLYPDSSWQTGFVETVIWQINKNSGYTGGTLNAVVHNNIMCVGKSVRNLCPAKGGVDLHGPDMYFLSDRNLDPVNDSVFLVHINDTIGAPGFAITVTPLITPLNYYVPPQASQPGPGTQLLETNDSRILSAFYENDKIQYVHNCLDTVTGNAAVYHGIIDNVSTSPTITGRIISDTLLEIGYPAISYAGSGTTDNTAIISFDHTALTVFPGVSALTTDGAGSYSPFTTVKAGAGYLNILSGNERWGDYSGSQRKYDQTGKVWINGMWANVSRKNTTWISELSLTSLAGVDEAAEKDLSEMTLYPNPTADLMFVDLDLKHKGYLTFEVLDMQGKLVKLLLRNQVKKGKNVFSFSTAPLPNGTYLLKIVNGEKEVLAKKFVKA